ncbi:UPF0182 protein Hore_10710 [Candidatus Moduliflexus flocculans]|uniref:UPF0182 protein U14_04726 n=1 Tax=Candidatus Moduliflexus flocculans TaxID=1499966 RepID=A0A0S6W112_9BACT|nr:UPF0182 protein Hore_10710 [Candidatus Moduliflexus flocculans]
MLALFTGISAAPHWETLLKYFHSVPFGKNDPLFGRDIGFYVFSLPVYHLINSWLMSLTVLGFIGSAAIYGLNGLFAVQGWSLSLIKHVKHHLYGLVIFGLLLKAWSYRLQMFDLLFSRQGLVFGAGYTDYYADRFALWGLLLYVLALAALTLSGLFSSKDRAVWVIIGVVLLIPIAIVIQGVVPSMVQQMIVKPNEFIKEEPFIKHNIEMTNNAYGLTDIAVKSFPAENALTFDTLKQNEDTVNNIRLWDQKPLLSTYQQIQSIRTYYTFYNVDVDRYEIDGKVRQVMLAPRELEREKLAAQAQTWVTTRLTYTHGYGVVMNPVNSVTPEGLPDLFIKDIPPVSSVGLDAANTAVYFGEQQAGQTQPPQGQQAVPQSLVRDRDDYVIVRTKNPEFHYPSGDENTYITYDGTGGIWMGSLFRRLLFAWGFRDMNILLTGSTTNESRIMFRRNIQARIRHIAPFLELDNDPYIVLSEGRLFWLQDAYVMTDRYPYSEPVYYKRNPINYIRNSVKIVVDAYNGSVDFYLVDQNEPLGKTYQNIFPGMFKDFAAMPDGLKAHIRYPHDLFAIQMLQYNTYHMKDPKVFYSKEDLWTIPKETYGDETVQMEPYYIQMRLPGEEKQEFILMNPVTPKNKDNMIAWFAVRCDQEHYGELLVYKFPKDKLVYGPAQIEARINQDTTISQQFSLWDQRGSAVIRGNLLVIPIDGSILYVEPVYLKAEQRDLPELKRVVASYGGEVAMELTLQQALEAVFGGKLRPEEERIVERIPADQLQTADIGSVVQQLSDHFSAARQSLAQGDWIKYGEEMARAEEMINVLQQQYGTPK